MKTWGKKCILVLVALVIALGSAAAIMGCKAKKSEEPAKKAAEPAKKAAEKVIE
jgi:flagellar basal body-associated protein FliL